MISIATLYMDIASYMDILNIYNVKHSLDMLNIMFEEADNDSTNKYY